MNKYFTFCILHVIIFLEEVKIHFHHESNAHQMHMLTYSYVGHPLIIRHSVSKLIFDLPLKYLCGVF